MPRFGRFRRYSLQAIHDIPLTPLIDTALALLIIFMVTTPMLHNALKVNLPKGKSKEDQGAAHEFVISIDNQNHWFFNGKKYEYQGLLEAMKQQAKLLQEKTVVVKADEVVRYGQVIEFIDQLKVLGIKHVVLAMQKRV